MKEKLITVVIPTFGRSEFLVRAINSVLKQSYTNFEVIVVDDNGRGSKNQIDTYKKISDLLSRDDRIRYIVHDENKNGSAARNTGIKHAKGKYICFLDDDDEFLEDKLLRQYTLLERLGEDWVACYTGHIRYFDNNVNKNYQYKPTIQGNILFEVLNFSVDACSGSTLMIRKSLIPKVCGFNENLKRHQDYEFLAKVAYYGKIAVISEPMVKIHVHEGSYRQKRYEDIEKTRLDYLKCIQPYLSKLTQSQQKKIRFVNNFWLLKRSLFHKKYTKTIKYFFLCRSPLLTIYKLISDGIKYFQRDGD